MGLVDKEIKELDPNTIKYIEKLYYRYIENTHLTDEKFHYTFNEIYEEVIVLYDRLLKRKHFNSKEYIDYAKETFSNSITAPYTCISILSIIIAELNESNTTIDRIKLAFHEFLKNKSNNTFYFYYYETILKVIEEEESIVPPDIAIQQLNIIARSVDKYKSDMEELIRNRETVTRLYAQIDKLSKERMKLAFEKNELENEIEKLKSEKNIKKIGETAIINLFSTYIAQFEDDDFEVRKIKYAELLPFTTLDDFPKVLTKRINVLQHSRKNKKETEPSLAINNGGDNKGVITKEFHAGRVDLVLSKEGESKLIDGLTKKQLGDGSEDRTR